MSSVWPQISEVKVTEMELGFALELEIFDRWSKSNECNSPTQAKDEGCTRPSETESAKVEDNTDSSGTNVTNKRSDSIDRDTEYRIKAIAEMIALG